MPPTPGPRYHSSFCFSQMGKALAVLELTDQAGFESKRCACLCILAKVKGTAWPISHSLWQPGIRSLPLGQD